MIFDNCIESVVADRIQLKGLVMKGSGRTYDCLPSSFRFEDMAFTKLKSVIINVYNALSWIVSSHHGGL